MRANTDSTPTLTSLTCLPERVYFPGLNGLRIYAALSVVIAHTSDNFGEMRAQPAHYALLGAIVLDSQSTVNLSILRSQRLSYYLSSAPRAVPRRHNRRVSLLHPTYSAHLAALLPARSSRSCCLAHSVRANLRAEPLPYSQNCLYLAADAQFRRRAWSLDASVVDRLGGVILHSVAVGSSLS